MRRASLSGPVAVFALVGVLALAPMADGAAVVKAATEPIRAASVPTAGSTSGGDPYFPQAGNGGYDVTHYALTLRYTPHTHALLALAVINARATTALSSFSLDLRGLKVSSVAVNRAPARFTRPAGELVITPKTALAAGQAFVVRVGYGGTTGKPVDNTGAPYGWYSTKDGAMVADEPDGASTWYPVNDVPYDKATYDVRVIVPRGTVGWATGCCARPGPVGAGRRGTGWRTTSRPATWPPPRPATTG